MVCIFIPQLCVGGIPILLPDLLTASGVVHVLDGALPPGSPPAPADKASRGMPWCSINKRGWERGREERGREEERGGKRKREGERQWDRPPPLAENALRGMPW